MLSFFSGNNASEIITSTAITSSEAPNKRIAKNVFININDKEKTLWINAFIFFIDCSVLKEELRCTAILESLGNKFEEILRMARLVCRV